MNIINRITSELNLKTSQVEAAIKLIDEGATIPFIARYRKEVTGGLDDSELRNLSVSLIYLRKLEERINTVLKSVEEQGALTTQLKEKIENVLTLVELEDLYRPYKPKKKTRASIAKGKGLGPLASFILKGEKHSDFDEYLKTFINEEKKVNSSEEALSGAKDIIAEIISDNPDYRKYIKEEILRAGLITSKEIGKDEKDTYHQYSNYQEVIKTIPSHRILAINRGEKEKCLSVSLEFDKDKIFDFISFKESKDKAYKEIINEAISDSLKRLIYPSVENEIRNDLFSRAEDSSILVFKSNLQSLLMYPPVKDQIVLGFDPGFRTGCKYALCDSYGNPSLIGVSLITAGSEGFIQSETLKLEKLLKSNKINYIALGNGTASRESETILSKIIKDNNLSVKLTIVNESGASVYSASKLGEEEFPDLTVEKRSAISLARRLQDPLSELVKIDPKSIGVGQYQHDMNEAKLDLALGGVVEDCVNKVGVNVNVASVSLLKYVAGCNKTIANNIFNYRLENGLFSSRSDLKKVKGMGPKAFEQCAGFLRIIDGKNPLDNTGVHPESYSVAKQIMAVSRLDLLKDDENTRISKLNGIDIEAFLSENKSVGKDTLIDIINELKEPGRDIREAVKIVELNNDVKDIKDLQVGMILNGTVRNIIDFGAFVDINVQQDGLVHISEIADKFIKHPLDVLSINDIVKVKVISVDLEKKRIGLSIKKAK